MRKRIISTLLCMLMIAGVITAAMPSASAAIDWNCNYVYISYYGQVVDSITFNGVTVQSLYAPRNQVSNYDSDTTLCCAAFVKRFYENVFGVGVYNLFEGATPCISYGGGSFSETSSPVVGDIARGPNHWAIVKAVSGNTITLIEQNAWSSDYTKAAVGRRIIEPESTYTYFHYSGNTSSSAWYDSLSPVNLGDDFYAAIIKNSSWINIGNVNGNVQLIDASKTPAGADMWHFKRQGDGSYVIFNCLDGNALDVTGAGTTNGTNIGTYPYWGHDAQKWYIYGRWSGEYIFRPKLCDKVLDVTGNNDTIGTNVELWTYNNSGAQQLAIWKVDGVGSSVLSVTPGSSNTETKFTWTAASNATHYSLRIRKGSPGNTQAYKDVWGTTETSYSIVLPAGYYEVYVDAANSFSYLASNTVSFTVKESVQGDANCDGKVNLLDGVLAQKVSLQMTTLSEQGIANADMNGDGKITILDAILIQKKALSL